MLKLAARLVQQHLDIFHRLGGLRRDITDMQGFPGIQILGNLAAQKYPGAPGNHGLAKIIIETLLRIGFPGVERPNALMNHVNSSFLYALYAVYPGSGNRHRTLFGFIPGVDDASGRGYPIRQVG